MMRINLKQRPRRKRVIPMYHLHLLCKIQIFCLALIFQHTHMGHAFTLPQHQQGPSTFSISSLTSSTYYRNRNDIHNLLRQRTSCQRQHQQLPVNLHVQKATPKQISLSSAAKNTDESLADMEDVVEQTLNSNQQIDYQPNGNSNTANPMLQHNLRAPTTSSSSSNTFQTTIESSFSIEDDEMMKRQLKIQEILEEDDKKWKEERRKKILGKYADIEDGDEWKKVMDEEKSKAEKENELKTKVAQNAGVQFDILEREVPLDTNSNRESNFKPINVKGKSAPSWFQDIDNVGGSGNDDKDDTGPKIVDGKLVIEENEGIGIRVGSAGGWTLEVFPGDFVVHRKYGIGRYEKTVIKSKTKLSKNDKANQNKRRNEIIQNLIKNRKELNVTQSDIEEQIANFGSEKDLDPISNPMQTVLEVSYADATVHIPVDKAYRLSRYRAGDAVVKPRLSRVKGEAWRKAKNKVEEDTIQMAQDVLALYATRETLSRNPFDPTKEVIMRKFEATFPYEATPDQQKCFEAVENDMVWRSRPMDRLVCGDVGFGKTEVAFRALFRCVTNGRQAALLSPTGVLAAQHFKNTLERMGPGTEFNFNIVLLRGGMGKNTKLGRAIREQIASGEVDLIVGTHALLSSGLNFNDLGLLVVDEEQRFGVKQKERLKLICDGIDVLTLSATPIPRTLQMSLSGIRDTSTIRSPPPMRKPTVTMVQEFNKSVIKEAIQCELNRGGQLFYVVPRIAQLDEAEKIVKSLYPEIKIVKAHGRMARGKAEENVAAFAEGNYDVLLATTVIENGVDIPTVNTIIIQNAQAFGMSTLYQLRGRVGRSNVQAYAYFLHKEDAITEQSALRLQAMADLHELGSGFDVANRDLEIRGAGSLLGTEQSGMAAKVGFDLYMRMLKKSVRKLRGLDLPQVPRTNVLLPYSEGSLEIAESSNGVVTHAFQIPKTYIKDDSERFMEEGIARLAESTGQLVEITNRWKDQYGPIPAPLQRKLKTLHLHACTRILGIDLVGFVKTSKGTADCVLRSPGLRPRHWIHISKSLPKGIPTKGVDVVFPSRFTIMDEAEINVTGGKSIDVEQFQVENYEDEEDEWDALDQEEVEAMKEISSSMFVKSIGEVDIEDYPRFVVRNIHEVKRGARIDILLRVLLPASKIVHEKEKSDKEKAKIATGLREKREIMKQQKKEQEKSLNNNRMGYTF